MNTDEWSFWLGLAAFLLALGFSASRMSLSSLSGGKIRKLESVNRDLAERLEPWLNRREEYLLLIRLLLLLDVLLICYCLVSWMHVVHSRQESEWLVWLISGIGGTLYFVGVEVLGKHLSPTANGRFLAIALPVIRVMSFIFFPFGFFVFFWHRWSRRWLQNRLDTEEAATAEDEIMSLVEKEPDEGNATTELEDDERRMIRGIFDLDETLVHEIMTPRVDVCGVDESVSIGEVKTRIVESGHSRIPVYRGSIDEIVGVIYAKDLLDDDRVTRARSLSEILHPAVFIPETKNVGDLLQEFRQTRNHFAVILDEYGGTAGIVTFEDILEEIVGEIRDEYDIEIDHPTRQELPDGTLVVDARTTIDEINEELEIELPEDEDFDTVGGYISAYVGRIPQAGETVETDQLVAEILGADPRRILKMKVWRKPAPDETGNE